MRVACDARNASAHGSIALRWPWLKLAFIHAAV